MKIKLIYFDFNFWRLDILRVSLSFAKITYDLERIPRADWLKNKQKFPFGQLPVLITDDQVFCHTHSLAIFCATKSNLYSSDEKTKMIINQVIDWANDVTYRIAHSIREKNEEKSKKLRRIFIEKDLLQWFEYLEKFFILHSKNNYFTGDFSIADITAWRLIRWFTSGNLDQIDTGFINKFPNLNNFYKNIIIDKKICNLNEFKEIMS